MRIQGEKMRIIMMVIGALLIAGLPAIAEEQPKFQIFGGYSFLYMPQEFSANNGDPNLLGVVLESTSGRANHSGWNASLAYNLSRHFALIADTSGHYQSDARNLQLSWGSPDNMNELRIKAKSTTYSFLFGPRVQVLGDKKVSPFVHALLGISRMNRQLTGLHSQSLFSGEIHVPIRQTLTDTGFAFALGGGVDWRCSKRISIRLIQAEYIRTEKEFAYDESFLDPAWTKESLLNGLRVSTGIILNIGKR
jgi:opacity protein-like surface antigen